MAGRLGAPNAGRLTTSAFLKSSGAIFGPAATAFFQLPYKSALATDNLSISPATSLGWSLGTVISDSIDLGTDLLRGSQQAGTLSDSATLSDPTIGGAFAKYLAESLRITRSTAVEAGNTIFIPDTTNEILRDLYQHEPVPFSNALEAYNYWKSVSGSGVNVSSAPYINNYSSVPLNVGFGILGVDQTVWINAVQGGIGLYVSPSTVTSAVSAATGNYGSGGNVFYQMRMPSDKYYDFFLGMLGNDNNIYYLSDFQAVIYPGISEVVIYMRRATYSATNTTTMAYRLQPNYIEAVFTANTDETIESYNNRPAYMQFSGTTVRTVKAYTPRLRGASLYLKADNMLAYFWPQVNEIAQIADTTPQRFYYSTQLPTYIDVYEEHPVTYVAGINKSVTTSDALTLVLKPGPIIDEVLNTQDVLSAKATYGLTTLERTQIRDALLRAFPNTLTDSATVTDLAASVRALLVLERLNLSSTAGVLAKYRGVFAEALRISDSLRNFFGEDVSDALTFADATLRTYKLPKSATESISVADVLANKLIFRITARDGVNIDDINVLKMLFKPTLLDGVDITAAYVSPNGNLTTWAVNTETGAVTEYTNYGFNSFAQLGRKYLGASSGGLYELNGDDDAGTDIIATLKSGLAQFGGSRFTMFKAAYMGVRGGGDYVLRLETGDGRFYDYNVIAQDMQTTKVRLGKGLRARYFSFELTSTGQDFDLDSVEFVPLVAQRRV